MKALMQELNYSIDGEVYFDDISKRIYSIDASIFQVEPIGVVVAKNLEDIHKAVRLAKIHNVPIIARGAATGINGACIGKGIIIDTSKYLKKIHEVNYEEGYALCEAGVIQDQLNTALAPKGFCLGPDTSTGNRATIGGMVGNNAAGAHSLRYGKMVDHVISLHVVLSNGETVEFGEETEASFNEKRNASGQVAEIYKCVHSIRENHTQAVDNAFPKIQRRVSGYNLDEIIKPFPINMAKLIVGSEGTLGIAKLIKVKISPKPAHTVLSVMHFKDFENALNNVQLILEHKPFSVELIDKHVMDMGKQAPMMKGQLDWLCGDPEVLLVAEFDASTPGLALKKQSDFQEHMRQEENCYANVLLADKVSQGKVWKLRKAGLGLLMSKRSNERAVAFLEDVAVPTEKLGSFLAEFKKYFNTAGKTAGFYGHAGVGCVHVRPMLDLRQQADVDLMVKSMEDIADLLKEYGGAVSGEHGDGLTRSWLNEKMFGSEVYGLFKDLKKAFDPQDLMNPGKVVDGPMPTENLKVTQNNEVLKVNTQYDFSKEGGWNFAVDMCNGNGECRRESSGTMCPSFQAYGDERHSTRARAQGLKAVLNGGLAFQEFAGKDLYKVLDLCIECKACKTECPSNVDMAKMKSEFLYHYQEKNGYSLRSRLFANIHKTSKLAVKIPGIVNFVNATSSGKWLLSTLGISSKRDLPQYARETFSKWYAKQEKSNSSKRVILFNDTFTEHNSPRVGRAAFRVLTALGYEVEVPPYVCCGRPMISKGFLKEAKLQARKLVETLRPYIHKSEIIVGLEPSCILTIADDYPDLISGDEVKKLSKYCMTIDQFLAQVIDKGEFNASFLKGKRDVLMHGHCHQKSLEGTGNTMKVLNELPGICASEVDSGCCGMAGSFGYEKEHYDFSMKIGEGRLFPAIRKAHYDTEIISNGMSCRCQIIQGAKRTPHHLIEFLEQRLDASKS
ncbi:MAG: FAD-binding protein [Lentisphaeraceae bacterium]|nr:FAD-binding protein [Lentisphaeraceae bacterium]